MRDDIVDPVDIVILITEMKKKKEINRMSYVWHGLGGKPLQKKVYYISKTLNTCVKNQFAIHLNYCTYYYPNMSGNSETQFKIFLK